MNLFASFHGNDQDRDKRMKHILYAIVITVPSLFGFAHVFGQAPARTRTQMTPMDSERRWGAERHGLCISVKPERERFRLGEPISLSVVVSNLTEHTLSLPSFDPNFENKLVVVDTQSKQIPFTDRGRVLDGEPGAMQLTKRTVRPQGTTEDTLRVDDRFRLGATGTYFVTVRRIVMTEGHKFAPDLISNTAQVEIVPAESAKPAPPN